MFADRSREDAPLVILDFFHVAWHPTAEMEPDYVDMVSKLQRILLFETLYQGWTGD